MSERIGIVMAITGGGKGKTTAALGMALRAAGRGQKVLIIQFMKAPGRYGEEAALAHVPGVRIIPAGRDGFVNKANPDPADIAKAEGGLALAEGALASGEWDLLILDELHTALDFGLLPLDRVLALLDAKPPTLSIVTTGRQMPPEIGRKAHTVSEVQEIKHHCQQSIPFQEGIEY